MNIDLIAFNCRYTHSCLALFYVRNELEKHFPASFPTIKQFTINDPYYKTLLTIKDAKADALFFSVYIWNDRYLHRIITDLHAIIPHIPIVLGGPQAVALRERLSCPVTVVLNQVEGVDPLFYQDLERGSLRPEYQGGSIKTFAYPYRQEDFQGHLKNRHIYYESTRGCPFFCSYCLSSVSRGVMAKDIHQVKQELLNILKHSPKNIRFVDRTFNADPERALELWKFLLENAESETSFHFEIAPDLFTEEMFRFLTGVPKGIFQFEIGVQSTSQETLHAVNRKMPMPDALNTITRIIKLGTIDTHIDLILGLPKDNKETYAQSVRDVLALQPDYIQMGLLKILPDTEIAKNAQKFGLVACSEAPYEVMETRWMSNETISEYYWLGECIESFYNTKYFKTFFKYLRYSNTDLFSFFYEILVLCQKNNFFSLAKTQDMMNTILFMSIKNNKNKKTLAQTLIFDWLLCGYKHLPKLFDENLNSYKEKVSNILPNEFGDVFTKKERNYFIKNNCFFKFTYEIAIINNYNEIEKDFYVCFFSKNNNRHSVIPIPFVDH